MRRPRRKTPVILQMEATECGAACLAMVMAAHGHPMTLEEARTACATARDGVDAARLVVAARGFGLTAHGLRHEPEDLAGLPLPAILHWNFDHFVVLERVSHGRFLLLDPAVGRRNVSREEFGRAFTGIVLTFEPGPDFVTTAAKLSTLGLLVEEARRSPDAMLVSACLGISGIVPALVTTGAVAVFTDHVAGRGRADWALFVALALVATVGLQFLIAHLGARVIAALQAKIATHVAVGGFWSALFLPASFFAQRNAGEIVARLRLGSDVGRVVAGPLATAVPNVVTALGYLAILALYAWPVAAVAGGIAVFNLLLMALLSRRVAEADAAFQIADGFAAGAATAGLAAMEIYRMHGRESLLLDRIAAAEDQGLEREQRIGVLRAIGSAAPAASGALLTGVVLCLGAIMVMDGRLTLGGLVACQMIAGLLNAPIIALAASLPEMQEAAGAFKRLDDLRRHPPAPAFMPDRRTAAPATNEGRIRLDGVRFGYVPDQDLLHDIHLEIASGRLVAIMGASGCGKTTLARLVAGMLEAAGGTVSLDGLDIGAWPHDLLRQRLVYVPQDPAVFSGTIDENITMWGEAHDEAAITAAIERSGLRAVLGRRPGGTRSPLAGHAPALSGGEMQRLAFARALARRPKVLVLDETTSALDVEAEVALIAALRETGATVVLVTHRISAALQCDEVVVLEAGRIVGRGPPRALFPHQAKSLSLDLPSLPQPLPASAA